MKYTRILLPVCMVMACCMLLPKAYCEDYKSPFSTNWKYHNPTGNRFPIMASGVVPEGMPITHQTFQLLEECGFNLVNLNPSIRNIPEALESAKGTSVLFDIDLPHLTRPTECMKAMDGYRHEPRIAMFDFGDEKKMDDMQKIAVSYNAARDSAITQLPIFNRGILYNAEIDNRAKRIRDELVRLEEMFRPAVWCFDRYPIMSRYPDDRKSDLSYPVNTPYVAHDWFLCLESYRDIANSTGRPFWSYILSMGHKAAENDIEKNYMRKREVHRLVSKEFMTFSAFSALAYGAKGLRFWTYSLRKSNDGERYTAAPIDLEGNRTKVWYMAKDVIAEVRANEGIYLNSEVEAVYHSGSTQFRGTTPQPAAVGPFSSLKANGTAGVLTSLMKANGKTYVMIVNHDILKKQTVSGTAPGYTFTRKGGGSLKKKNGGRYDISLSPGGYILMEYSRN